MHFTRFTDYALRVLVYVARRPDEWVTIRQVSEAYGISRNHLMKVVSFLGSRGFLVSQRGPGGGVRLGRPADQIRLADVVLEAEGDLALLETAKAVKDPELDAAQARLVALVSAATGAFVSSLEQHSLADVVAASKRPEEPAPALG